MKDANYLVISGIAMLALIFGEILLLMNSMWAMLPMVYLVVYILYNIYSTIEKSDKE